ncbi:anaphase promoting complex subunit cdc16 [Gaertneriomyces sp. JEL0708]|nr:anaphase promoting complex subunit cdc16 [Gaertneriomyces sp. JEL0708]
MTSHKPTVNSRSAHPSAARSSRTTRSSAAAASAAGGPAPIPNATRRPSASQKAAHNTTNGDRDRSSHDGTRTGLDLVKNLRQWRSDAYELQLWDTAAFWGDKALTISGDPADYYWQAKTYVASGQYARAETLLTHNDQIMESSVRCRFMAAFACVRLGKWEQASLLLNENEWTVVASKSVGGHDDECSIKLDASVYYLRGVVHSRLGDMRKAHNCMKKAVMHDPRCVEAFHWLIDNHVMSRQEEEDFVRTVDFQICGIQEDFMRNIYYSSLKKFDEQSVAALESNYKLCGNHDILLRRAEALFKQCKYKQCYNITSSLVKQDPFNLRCVPLHVSCLSELGLKAQLFYFAHILVDAFPEKACTWYAVGAYYLLIDKNIEARRYFSKSTGIDNSFGPAWMGFAHSFAAEGETDQAISAYSTSMKLFNGMHQPLLYLGMHQSSINNFEVAQDYLQQAEALCDDDPMIANELGVLHMRRGDSAKAAQVLLRAVDLAKNAEMGRSGWETILFNLAQAYRRSGDFDSARKYAHEVIKMNHQLADAYALLGFMAHAENDLSQALEWYQLALSYNPEDVVCQDLVHSLMEDLPWTYDDPDKWPGDFPQLRLEVEEQPLLAPQENAPDIGRTRITKPPLSLAMTPSDTSMDAGIYSTPESHSFALPTPRRLLNFGEVPGSTSRVDAFERRLAGADIDTSVEMEIDEEG